jgi:hypothetical protein
VGWQNFPTNGGDNLKSYSITFEIQDQGIKSFERWNHTFPYVSGLKSDDIGDLLNQILDEPLKQLK